MVNVGLRTVIAAMYWPAAPLRKTGVIASWRGGGGVADAAIPSLTTISR